MIDLEAAKLDALQMYQTVYIMDVQRGCSPSECKINAQHAMDSYMEAVGVEYGFVEDETNE